MLAMKIAIDHANATLDEAKEYYKDYIMFKDTAPKMASTSLDMAKIHANQLYPRWHEVIIGLKSDYVNQGKTIPSDMKKLYEYEHQNLVEEYDEIKYRIDHAM
jgi:hypothetical protein